MEYNEENNCDYKWRVVEDIAAGVTESNEFWEGISIWINRPHILNKRISTITILESIAFNIPSKNLTGKQIANEILSSGIINIEHLMAKLGGLRCWTDSDSDYLIQIRSHFPKHQSKVPEEDILIKDMRHNIAVFVPKEAVYQELKRKPNFLIPQNVYSLQFVTSPTPRILLHLYDASENFDDSSEIDWLKNKILPKISKWVTESLQTPQRSRLKFPSLKLISTQRYVTLYQHLKQKYGPKLVESWPESTDPHKFVYEDIGLVTYILILWEQQRQESNDDRKQSFVDLGCGNGLLVHILCSEGEKTFTPSPSNLFPDYDWIIGNHSDELTPWIPVIAARSSPKTCFLVLPCCAYNFDSKFQRRNSKLSQYEDYIEFVQETVRICGFKDEIDKMRIPSTKRICLIGRTRDFKPDMWPTINSRIDQFVKNNCTRSNEASNDGMIWANNFQPRSAIQLPKNCTTIEQCIKDSIVKVVVAELLKCSCETILVSDANQSTKTWHTGGILELSELATCVKPDDLQKLKSEFGGLQTLLRNHHHIFQVIQGKVQLRNYLIAPPMTKKFQKTGKKPYSTLKTKPCWFDLHHPDGCVLESSCCFYVHTDNLTKINL